MTRLIPAPNENTFEVDNTILTIASIKRQSPTDQHTGADTVTWRVTFSEPARNVDAGDFRIDGTTAELTVTEADTSLSVYDISATGGDLANLNDTVTLIVTGGGGGTGGNITDFAGNSLDLTKVPTPNEYAFEIDNTELTIASIKRQSPTDQHTGADTLTWRVTFSEPARNVDASDFRIGGTTAELTVTAVETSQSIYDMSIAGGDLANLNGTVTLSLANGRNITDLAGNPLDIKKVPTPNENAFELDNLVPTVASITRHIPTEKRTNSDSVTWRVTFSEAVQNVDAADFQIEGTTAQLTVISSPASMKIYNVKAAGGDLMELNGTITLSLASGWDIADFSGNIVDDSAIPSPNENAYELDNTVPVITSIKREAPTNERTDDDRLVWRVSFSEEVRNVDAMDFTVGGTTAELTVTAMGNSVTDYEVSVAGGDLAELNGTVTLSLSISRNIEDLVGNAINAAAVPSLDENTFIVDNQTLVIASIERETPTDGRTSADSIAWRVTFNKAVQNVEATDFIVSGTTAVLTVTADRSIFGGL